MSQIKFYIDIFHDYERKYRLREDGTYRQLDNDFSLISGDFVSENPVAIRNHIDVDTTIKINGGSYPLNPTSGTLGEVDRFHTYVYVKREVKPELPSLEQLTQVIESGDDRRSNILILNVLGKFELRDMRSMDYRDPTIILRYESFIAGNGYIGSEAAKDENFIHSLYSTALEEWRDHLKTGRVNHYRDDFSQKNVGDLKSEIGQIVIPK